MTEETSKRTLAKASFQVTGGEKIEVDFNPQTLQYDVTNKLTNKGKSDKKKTVHQFVIRETEPGYDLR